MRILFLLFIPCLAFAGGPKYKHDPAKLDDEVNNVYHDMRILTSAVSSATASVAILQTNSTNFVTVTGNQSVAGVKDFTGQLLGKGTATNDAAAAGYIGEYVVSTVGNVAAPTSGEWGDVTSISLTAGDWDVTYLGSMNAVGSAVTDQNFGIGTTSGNNSPGASQNLDFANTTVGTKLPTFIKKRFLLTSTTTVYAKMNFTWVGGSVFGLGSIQARRIR